MSFTPYQGFGVECGRGWAWLVVPLMQYCADHDIPISQIKEKFGGLRFYYGAYESSQKDVVAKLDGLIAQAEHLAEQTCEVCGAPGALREGGWMQTLCEEHAGGRAAREPIKSIRQTIIVASEKKL